MSLRPGCAHTGDSQGSRFIFASTHARTHARTPHGVAFRNPTQTNEYMRQVDSLAGKLELLLSTVKRRKLSLFGNITRHNTISKIASFYPPPPRFEIVHLQQHIATRQWCLLTAHSKVLVYNTEQGYIGTCLQHRARIHWYLSTTQSKDTLVLANSAQQGYIGTCQQHIARIHWYLSTAT